jgi:hypothetical protein
MRNSEIEAQAELFMRVINSFDSQLTSLKLPYALRRQKSPILTSRQQKRLQKFFDNPKIKPEVKELMAWNKFGLWDICSHYAAGHFSELALEYVLKYRGFRPVNLVDLAGNPSLSGEHLKILLPRLRQSERNLLMKHAEYRDDFVDSLWDAKTQQLLLSIKKTAAYLRKNPNMEEDIKVLPDSWVVAITLN